MARTYTRRRTRARHYLRSRFHRPHKQSLITKAINVTALVIGLSPAIQAVKTHLIDERGNFAGIGPDLANRYSAGMSVDGQFHWDQAVATYGPLVGAIVFKKAVSFLRRNVKM